MNPATVPLHATIFAELPMSLTLLAHSVLANVDSWGRQMEIAD